MPTPCHTPPQYNANQAVLAATTPDDAITTALERLASPDPDGAQGDIGRVVYQSLQDNTHLTGAQKLEVCSRIGHEVASQEALAAAGDATTFLRTTTPGVKFISTAVQDMASGYIQGVTNQALQSGQQHAGAGDYNDATLEISQSLAGQKHQLSEHATKFLQSCAAAVPDNLANGKLTLMRTALVLNNVCPSIVNATMGTRAADPAANAAYEANRSVLQFVNSMGGGNAPNYPAAVNLRNSANGPLVEASFQDMVTQISQGNIAALKAGAPVNSVAQTLADKQANAQQKLENRQEKLDRYLARSAANDKKLQMKQDSLAVNQAHDNLQPGLAKEAADIQQLQQKSVGLNAKVQAQQQKVQNSEQRLDQIKTRMGRL